MHLQTLRGSAVLSKGPYPKDLWKAALFRQVSPDDQHSQLGGIKATSKCSPSPGLLTHAGHRPARGADLLFIWRSVWLLMQSAHPLVGWALSSRLLQRPDNRWQRVARWLMRWSSAHCVAGSSNWKQPMGGVPIHCSWKARSRRHEQVLHQGKRGARKRCSLLRQPEARNSCRTCLAQFVRPYRFSRQ